jgi:alkylation response protein AidB-like acyl-CoA dehydrogenase
MNFDFVDTDKVLHESVKGCFNEDAKAVLAQIEKGDTDQIRSQVFKWLGRLEQTDYLTLGLDDIKTNVTLTSTQEVLAGISPSLFLSVEVSTRIFGRLIASYGTYEQKDEILPVLKAGRFIGAAALSEDGVGIDSNLPQTRGAPSDDGYCVNGHKGSVVNGPIADWIAVAGKTDGGVAFFLVKKGSQGLTIGERLPTLGCRGTAISNISLDSCSVSSRHVIGPFEEEEHFGNIRMWEDQILTAASLGLMQRSLDAASDYAKCHMRGGKPVIAHQEVGFKLAEMLTLLQTCQLLAYRAAWMADTKDREAAILTHCAKVFCSESAEKVASHGLQVMGGEGYLCGNPAEQSYRDSKYFEIAGTSSDRSLIEIGDTLLEGI